MHAAAPLASPAQVVELLENAFREFARRGTYKATAVVHDVRVVPPGATAKTDAIALRLDHRDNYSVEVMIPYQRATDGTLAFGIPFAVQGKGAIIERR